MAGNLGKSDERSKVKSEGERITSGVWKKVVFGACGRHTAWIYLTDEKKHGPRIREGVLGTEGGAGS